MANHNGSPFILRGGQQNLKTEFQDFSILFGLKFLDFPGIFFSGTVLVKNASKKM